MTPERIPESRSRDDQGRVLVGLNPDLFKELQHTVRHTEHESVEEFVTDAVVRRCVSYATEIPPYTINDQVPPDSFQESLDNLRTRIQWYGLGEVFWDE